MNTVHPVTRQALMSAWTRSRNFFAEWAACTAPDGETAAHAMTDFPLSHALDELHVALKIYSVFKRLGLDDVSPPDSPDVRRRVLVLCEAWYGELPTSPRQTHPASATADADACRPHRSSGRRRARTPNYGDTPDVADGDAVAAPPLPPLLAAYRPWVAAVDAVYPPLGEYTLEAPSALLARTASGGPTANGRSNDAAAVASNNGGVTSLVSCIGTLLLDLCAFDAVGFLLEHDGAMLALLGSRSRLRLSAEIPRLSRFHCVLARDVVERLRHAELLSLQCVRLQRRTEAMGPAIGLAERRQPQITGLRDVAARWLLRWIVGADPTPPTPTHVGTSIVGKPLPSAPRRVSAQNFLLAAAMLCPPPLVVTPVGPPQTAVAADSLSDTNARDGPRLRPSEEQQPRQQHRVNGHALRHAFEFLLPRELTIASLVCPQWCAVVDVHPALRRQRMLAALFRRRMDCFIGSCWGVRHCVVREVPRHAVYPWSPGLAEAFIAQGAGR